MMNEYLSLERGLLIEVEKDNAIGWDIRKARKEHNKESGGFPWMIKVAWHKKQTFLSNSDEIFSLNTSTDLMLGTLFHNCSFL